MNYELLSAMSLADRSITAAAFCEGNDAYFETKKKLHYESALRVLDDCKRAKATILHPKHESYPRCFLEIERPPVFLSAIGQIPNLKSHRFISIVGSREISDRARSWMRTELGTALNRNRDWVVVSGGARGVDQEAHRAAVRASRPTLVFLPSGLLHPYPAEFAVEFPEILEKRGAVISLFPPRQEIRRSHFEKRNQLIAALGRALFVVEARRRSGSIMTARLAVDLGRSLAVIPSFPTDVFATGTLDLLNQGAIPIRDALDLETYLNSHG